MPSTRSRERGEEKRTSRPLLYLREGGEDGTSTSAATEGKEKRRARKFSPGFFNSHAEEKKKKGRACAASIRGQRRMTSSEGGRGLSLASPPGGRRGEGEGTWDPSYLASLLPRGQTTREKESFSFRASSDQTKRKAKRTSLLSCFSSGKRKEKRRITYPSICPGPAPAGKEKGKKTENPGPARLARLDCPLLALARKKKDRCRRRARSRKKGGTTGQRCPATGKAAEERKKRGRAPVFQSTTSYRKEKRKNAYQRSNVTRRKKLTRHPLEARPEEEGRKRPRLPSPII